MPYVGFKAFPRFEPQSTQRAQRKTKALLSALCRESFNHGGTETRRREKKLFLCVSVVKAFMTEGDEPSSWTFVCFVVPIQIYQPVSILIFTGLLSLSQCHWLKHSFLSTRGVIWPFVAFGAGASYQSEEDIEQHPSGINMGGHWQFECVVWSARAWVRSNRLRSATVGYITPMLIGKSSTKVSIFTRCK